MSRNYWLPVVALGLAMAGVVHGKTIYHHAGRDGRAQHQQTEPIPYAKQSDLVPLQNQIDQISGAQKAIKAEAEAKDKTAAERSANAEEKAAAWAYDMVWVGGIETVVTAFGVLLVAWTLYHTKRAADAASLAVDEAKRATVAANRQADASEQTLTTVERPHLFVENIRFVDRVNRSWFDLSDEELTRKMIHANVEYDLVNYGRSPAIIRERAAGVVIDQSLPNAPSPNRNDVWNNEIVIQAGSARRGFSLFWRGKMTKEILGELFLGRNFIEGRIPTKLFFFVGVKYEGVNGAADEVGVIWEYLIDIEQWVPYEEAPNYQYRRLGSRKPNPAL